MAADFLKGALISFTPGFISVTPDVIVFQYNPETITHTWTAAGGDSGADSQAGRNPQAVKGTPGETFSFTLYLDANDMIADGSANPIASGLAQASGVYTRLAALEMLQYPMPSAGSSSLIGTVSASIGAAPVIGSATAAASGNNEPVPRLEMPTVLFVWGPQRIVPVRLTGLTINERLYDAMLNPTHAEAQITLRVLTPDELLALSAPMADVAKIAYVYTQGLRQTQALANLGDAAASIVGMLPTPF
ncbi:hypothetical protein G3N95_12045 [Paraburkholderia sp. Tr-20389]|uniref:hypothetical protein n=1 Tax=Paraburkholderia sp. Tr-20389 TaxID=2703903 RepID=UPI001980C874|nr:hypothetical protein [Paraburkholderia sp. Tr-20389]MBN3753673.1 hypothetical protein [Paraburkholderia sp. Tr-20389]